MAADCMGCAKAVRCPITAIAIAKGPEWDPYVRGPTNPILEWCRLEAQVAPLTLARSWSAMEQHIQGGNMWAKVTGPMSAMYMHLEEIVWKAESRYIEGHLTGLSHEKGSIWRPNDAATWVDFKQEI